MKRKFLLLTLLSLVFALTFATVHAQIPGGPDPDGVCRDAAGGEIPCPGDRDGDGLLDGSDRCPDADGDNTPDIDDACPADDSGADTTTPPPTEAPAGGAALLPPLGVDGDCVVATLREANVNVRNAPNMNAAGGLCLRPRRHHPVLERRYRAPRLHAP